MKHTLIALLLTLVATAVALPCGDDPKMTYATLAQDRCQARDVTLGFDDAQGVRHFVTLSRADALKLRADLAGK